MNEKGQQTQAQTLGEIIRSRRLLKHTTTLNQLSRCQSFSLLFSPPLFAWPVIIIIRVNWTVLTHSIAAFFGRERERMKRQCSCVRVCVCVCLRCIYSTPLGARLKDRQTDRQAEAERARKNREENCCNQRAPPPPSLALLFLRVHH